MFKISQWRKLLEKQIRVLPTGAKPMHDAELLQEIHGSYRPYLLIWHNLPRILLGLILWTSENFKLEKKTNENDII